jgi:hypothetical protein
MMTEWINVHDRLPENGQSVMVAAWEFGCTPVYILAHFWQSSQPGQPPKFYIGGGNHYGPAMEIGEVHFWLPIPELPPEQPGLFIY